MDKIIFFAALVLFPFGQLFKFGIFNLFDIAVMLLAMFTLLQRPKYPEWYRYFLYFIFACIFSLLVNFQFVDIKSILYLVRLVSYSLVAVYVSNYVKNKTAVSHWLLAVSIASAVFGWLQYLLWPDLTSLKYLGWDDHLLRMVGTFLDPTYLGLILVLGIIMLLSKKSFTTKWQAMLIFLIFSLAFTYSRSSYLALFIVFIIDLIKSKNLKKFVICNLIFVVFLLTLPKNIGEGTTLTRTVSGNNKLINYEETIEIFKKSPVIGVGFNNMCQARQKYLGDTNVESHACNGADSSILFLLSTVGIVGFILFISFIRKMTGDQLLKTSAVVVLLHSTFANSLFYPHIMFWLFCLVGLKGEVNSKRS